MRTCVRTCVCSVSYCKARHAPTFSLLLYIRDGRHGARNRYMKYCVAFVKRAHGVLLAVWGNTGI